VARAVRSSAGLPAVVRRPRRCQELVHCTRTSSIPLHAWRPGLRGEDTRTDDPASLGPGPGCGARLACSARLPGHRTRTARLPSGGARRRVADRSASRTQGTLPGPRQVGPDTASLDCRQLRGRADVDEDRVRIGRRWRAHRQRAHRSSKPPGDRPRSSDARRQRRQAALEALQLPDFGMDSRGVAQACPNAARARPAARSSRQGTNATAASRVTIGIDDPDHIPPAAAQTARQGRRVNETTEIRVARSPAACRARTTLRRHAGHRLSRRSVHRVVA